MSFWHNSTFKTINATPNSNHAVSEYIPATPRAAVRTATSLIMSPPRYVVSFGNNADEVVDDFALGHGQEFVVAGYGRS